MMIDTKLYKTFVIASRHHNVKIIVPWNKSIVSNCTKESAVS